MGRVGVTGAQLYLRVSILRLTGPLAGISELVAKLTSSGEKAIIQDFSQLRQSEARAGFGRRSDRTAGRFGQQRFLSFNRGL